MPADQLINCTETELTLYWEDGTTVLAEDRGYLNVHNALEPPYYTGAELTLYLKVEAGDFSRDTSYRFVGLVGGNAACLDTTGCAIFTDGFESGDTSAWKSKVP